MPDTRRHRGAHPADAELFAPGALPVLRAAVADLAWLLTRGYAINSALKLVGDRHGLAERQRAAVRRSTCPDESLAARRARRVGSDALAGEPLWIDGYNVLTTLEVALGGGVILIGRDGCPRDLAGVHGTYRQVEETRPALELIGGFLADRGAGPCTWRLDSPVGNSGRLAAVMRSLAADRGWDWNVVLEFNPDDALAGAPEIIATADAGVLERGGPWIDLAGELIRTRVPSAWLVDLSEAAASP